MAGNAEFYQNGFIMCLVVLIHLYIVQYLIWKKVSPLKPTLNLKKALYIHPNIVMVILTSVISLILHYFGKKDSDLLDKSIFPYLRFILPGLLITDSISIYKKSIMSKFRTLLW
jgi:hypothetical protein